MTHLTRVNSQSSVRPHVSGPNDVKVMQSVEDVEKKNVKIHKAYIVSCVNSRVQDLAAAAKVVKGSYGSAIVY